MMMNESIENWAVYRAQQILMHEGMDLAMSAQDFDTSRVRAKGKQLAMAIAASIMEASAAAPKAPVWVQSAD